MKIKVEMGQYQILKDNPAVLTTGFLGSGLAIGVVDKTHPQGGLCCFVLPYKDLDIEVEDDLVVFSGENLLPLFLEEMEKSGINWSNVKIVVAGGSVYQNNPEFLNLADLNLKITKMMFKRYMIHEDSIIFRTGLNSALEVEVDLEEKAIKIKIDGKEEKL
ncbi:chemotaxis protein CheD [Thermodesulfobacterium sp. TA1]|uniref:chemotaxis protein CheD n=1 Tax=Thermodesulfobacterium sp. TA1 TaxID=2234087 RepID=UPI0012327130|nr:chemotaxis protein CheD [Thermodesulfobacterium sp. TA1]QER42309.1 chemotaxis protein CheD [Thermodesulfobacterium sp. TA1]